MLQWNAVTETYNTVAWVTELQEWIEASSTFNVAKYLSPGALGNADEKDVITLLRAIREDTALMTALASYQVEAGNIVRQLETLDSVSYTIQNAALGLYFINAKNVTLGRWYQPVLVDVSPDQEGPTGNWYLSRDITAGLKYEDISISKQINNDLNNDIVRMGETVTYKIEMPIPEYPNDATNTKLFNVNDDMSEGYTYVDASAQITYYDSNDSTWKTLPQTAYSAILAPEANIYGTDTVDEFAYAVFSSTNSYRYYGLINGQMSLLGTYSDTESSWNTIRNAYQTRANTTINGTITKKPLTKSLLNFSFNYDELVALHAINLRITYDAVVNQNILIGSDDNTNQVTLYYQTDTTGTIGTTEDEVPTWTYGLNIVKIDGNDNTSYLAGAVFNLFRESDVFCNETTGAGTLEADYNQYIWLSNTDGKTSFTEAGSAATLDGVAGIEGTYFYLPVEIAADSCDHNSAAHTHIKVYRLFANNITSVADAGGVFIKGLDPATYLLIETLAPDGYNILSEAIQFSINKLGPEQVQARNDSFKAFVDDDNLVQEDGLYHVTVQNYTGIQLPSTGGIGTLIFTLAGVALMVMALIVIVLANRKKHRAEQ